MGNPGSQSLRPLRTGLGLHLVAGDHAAEGPVARGLDVIRDLVAGTQKRLDEIDRCARGRDLEEMGLISDRQRGAGRAGVEVAQKGDRGGVLGCPPGVRGRCGGAPARAIPWPAVSSKYTARTAS